jgi:dihydrofolate reductase
MAKLRLWISMSLDGFVAGPGQSLDDPLGIGGEQMHEWAIALEAWRREHGMQGGEASPSSAVVEEARSNLGATVMGRNMFGGHPGPWDAAEPWRGWWGEDPPFHHTVFVLTHHAREPLEMEGGTTFVFVTGGIEAALEQARAAAGDQDISLAGGASVAAQYLAEGLVDEIDLNIAPVLLGDGERLFDGAGTDLHGLELVQTVAAPTVTHLKLARR